MQFLSIWYELLSRRVRLRFTKRRQKRVLCPSSAICWTCARFRNTMYTLINKQTLEIIFFTVLEWFNKGFKYDATTCRNLKWGCLRPMHLHAPNYLFSFLSGAFWPIMFNIIYAGISLLIMTMRIILMFKVSIIIDYLIAIMLCAKVNTLLSCLSDFVEGIHFYDYLSLLSVIF